MLIGLTGGIACGKSTMLRIFSSLGWIVSDADAICHSFYENPEGHVIKRIIERWGEEVLTQAKVDRKKISSIVFNNKKEIQWLNELIHPLIIDEIKCAIKDKGKTRLFDIPLLFETKLDKYFDATISIWTTKELQIQRMKTRNWSLEEIELRLMAQLSADEKLERADYGIINTGDHNFLNKQCKYITHKLKGTE